MTFYAVLIEHPSSGPSQSPFHPFCHLSALRGRDPTPSPLSPWFWGWTKPIYNRVLPSALCVIFSLSSTSLSPSFLICEEGPKNVFLTAVLRGGHRYSEAPGSVRSLLSSLLPRSCSASPNPHPWPKASAPASPSFYPSSWQIPCSVDMLAQEWGGSCDADVPQVA